MSMIAVAGTSKTVAISAHHARVIALNAHFQPPHVLSVIQTARSLMLILFPLGAMISALQEHILTKKPLSARHVSLLVIRVSTRILAHLVTAQTQRIYSSITSNRSHAATKIARTFQFPRLASNVMLVWRHVRLAKICRRSARLALKAHSCTRIMSV